MSAYPVPTTRRNKNTIVNDAPSTVASSSGDHGIPLPTMMGMPRIVSDQVFRYAEPVSPTTH